jgi:hypothetical protein
MEPGEAAVREVFERWNSGVRDDLDDDRIDPAIEVHSALTKRVNRGPDQVRD